MSQYPQLAADLNVPLLGGDAYIPSIPLLNLIKRPLLVEGEYRGRHLKIFDFSKGSGKNRQPYHAVNVWLNQPTKLTFKLGVEGFFSKIGKAMGMQDIETGDLEFDQAFVLKSNDPNFVHSAFLPEIRQQILRAKQQWPRNFGRIELNNPILHYSNHGHLRKEPERARARALADAMNDLAAAIEVYSAP